MKVTSVELHPHGYSEDLKMSFRDPGRQNPYNVKGISGLDAEEIVAKGYGAGYYDLTLEKRDLGIRIGLNPRPNLGETFSSLRDFIYKAISSTRTGLVHIHFKDGETLVAELNAFIVKVEAGHFNKEQEVTITVSCDDPMLRAPNPVSVVVAGLDPAVATIDDPLSTAPHGFKFEAEILSPIASVEITDSSEPGWSFEVTPNGGFLTGDVLHFSSERKDRHLYLVRGGVTTHLADVITPGSVWPILFPGTNPFVFSNPTAIEFVSITHYPTYWGI